MRKTLSVLSLILIVAGVANAGYSTTGSSGEVSTLEIFQNIYGASLAGDNWCGTVYTDGTITATRVQDFNDPYSQPGAPGDDLYLLSSILMSTATDQTWVDGIATATARARFASNKQKFGYDDGTGYHQIIDIKKEAGFIDEPSDPESFAPGTVWKWVRKGSDLTWYSTEADNSDLLDHMLTYHVTGLNDGKSTWVVFWEDLGGGGDRDYNDFVLVITAIGHCTVPDVIGMTEEDANSTITAIEYLSVGDITYEYSDTVPAGFVISQNPDGGTAVPAGSSVDLVVSLGQPVVPNVVAVTEADANSVITAIDNLTVGTVTYQYNGAVAAGFVISQNPGSGVTVSIGSTVDLVVSLGVQMATVPDITGMTEAAAEAALIAVGLTKGAVTTSYSETVAVDLVISSTPSAGGSVAYGSAVGFEISLGHAPVVVPDITGMTESAAEAALIAAGLTKGAVTTSYSETVAVDLVISSTPSAGGSVAYGSAVGFEISLGHAPVVVPDITGMTESAAEAALIAVGLTKGAVTTSYSETVAVDLVISSTPSAGGSVAYGSAVGFEVSLGVEIVTVPDLVGQAQATAESSIAAAGLTVGTITYAYSGTVPAGDVISQDPVGGTTLPVGSPINLVVATGGPQTYVWTNDSPWSVLWSDSLNWDPHGIPGPADTALINPPPEQGPVMDRGISVGRINGPRYDSDADQFMIIPDSCSTGTIRIGEWELTTGGSGTATIDIYGDPNIIVGELWGMEDGTTIFNIGGESDLVLESDLEVIDGDSVVGIFNITENANFVTDGGWRLADSGLSQINISGEPNIVIGDDFRVGDGDDGRLELTMSGGNLYVGGDFWIGDDGEGTIDISGGTFTSDGEFKLQCRSSSADDLLNVSGSAVINCGELIIGDGSGRATMNISGGSVNTGDFLVANNNGGDGTLNMTGGDIVAGGVFRLGNDGTAIVNFDGGQISCSLFDHGDGGYSMDITEGVLVIDGDVVRDIEEDIAAGYITSYGGCGGRGDLMVDYDNFNLGKTTVWAQADLLRAWNPSPVCDEIEVPQMTTLSWSPGDDLIPNGRFVFLSTDWDLVNDGHILAYQGSPLLDEMPVGPLLLGRVYYWRVDQLSLATYTVGKIWQFTVESLLVFEDFEQYSSNPDYIYDTWVDGVEDRQTGSWVELAASPNDPVHGGSQAMWYHYDSSGVEREYPYSEATRVLETPEDLTDSGEAALVIWFYGQPDNDLEPMYAVMTDGSGNDAVSVYGVFGDDPNDIKSEDWIEWNIDLQDFADAGVDLTDIVSVGIGFGHRDPNGPVIENSGVVFFDDIRLYPTRCVSKYGPFGDLNDDCKVDRKDLSILISWWIEDRR